ncbi:hypothetical protein ASZ90_007062 [hydrocarbon metagenome]|uniref:Uncharacterized protein n=1 Tax=hydrocarbon metagenome TaxID=938273 RepID=A0A0W8FQD8_9ZZZZ
MLARRMPGAFCKSPRLLPARNITIYYCTPLPGCASGQQPFSPAELF